MKKMIFIFVGAVLLSSCAPSVKLLTNTTNQNLNQTQVVLSSNNFRVIGQISGVATGNHPNVVYDNAFADMMKKANLQGAQTIINIHYEHAVDGDGEYYVKATGTVIEFTN